MSLDIEIDEPDFGAANVLYALATNFSVQAFEGVIDGFRGLDQNMALPVHTVVSILEEFLEEWKKARSV